MSFDLGDGRPHPDQKSQPVKEKKLQDTIQPTVSTEKR